MNEADPPPERDGPGTERATTRSPPSRRGSGRPSPTAPLALAALTHKSYVNEHREDGLRGQRAARVPRRRGHRPRRVRTA